MPVGDRLYLDGESKLENQRERSKEYFGKLFKPEINENSKRIVKDRETNEKQMRDYDQSTENVDYFNDYIEQSASLQNKKQLKRGNPKRDVMIDSPGPVKSAPTMDE